MYYSSMALENLFDILKVSDSELSMEFLERHC